MGQGQMQNSSILQIHRRGRTSVSKAYQDSWYVLCCRYFTAICGSQLLAGELSVWDIPLLAGAQESSHRQAGAGGAEVLQFESKGS